MAVLCMAAGIISYEKYLMTGRRLLKSIHVAGTLCFLASFGYILVQALRQANVSWWVIFSLSGHSVLIVLLLISVYLFAMFRGIGGSQESAEHPLTSSLYYMAFYILSPFLGTVAGVIGMYGVYGVHRFLIGVSYATLGATFAVWIVIDPLIGLVESLMPASRKCRAERLELVAAVRVAKRERQEKLLDEVVAAETVNRQKWQEELEPYALQLAGLLREEKFDNVAQRIAARIGLAAWRIGGKSCMRELHGMVIDIASGGGNEVIDYIPVWWDGIGSWQNFNTLGNQPS
jgi:hypothetical protein